MHVTNARRHPLVGQVDCVQQMLSSQDVVRVSRESNYESVEICLLIKHILHRVKNPCHQLEQ
jgi:hypothetical protein